MTQLIITAVGPDRPGIVGEITSYLHKCGANILDTRMVNLRGQFSLIILVEVSADQGAKLAADLPAQAVELGLQLSVIPQSETPPRVEGLAYRLKTYSSDQPGIVARLTGLLRSFGINIEELAAWQESAAFAGNPIFLCEIKMTVPAAVSISTLRADVTRLCNELNCDADLEPLAGERI
ncbi:MAG: glycine cleavage system protein R [Burkholderiales bacterium]|nr:glycine cleavage system protein R [Phycisphaerae bacterium]